MLITKSLSVCLRDQPDDATLGATVAAWAELLGDVPAAQLQTCYQAAWSLPSHKAGFPVTADEILAVWQERITPKSRPYRLITKGDVLPQESDL